MGSGSKKEPRQQSTSGERASVRCRGVLVKTRKEQSGQYSSRIQKTRKTENSLNYAKNREGQAETSETDPKERDE